jgi:hypothetical protein
MRYFLASWVIIFLTEPYWGQWLSRLEKKKHFFEVTTAKTHKNKEKHGIGGFFLES